MSGGVIEPGYVYLQLADEIAERIRSGELAPGARLPGEIALAAELGVSTGTVRKILDELRTRGLVITFAAKGSYIAVRHSGDGGHDGH